jgi:plastocyanin
MRRFSWRVTVPALGVCVVAGLVAVAFGTGSAPAAVKHPAAAKPRASSKVTVITVTAGKPSELAFKLSKTSMVPVGKVTFKVTNVGAAFHNFKVCTIPIPAAAGAKNVCVGKGTPILKHGQSATLTVPFSLTGKYEFLCTVTGHAAAGMKGLIGIGVAVASAEEKLAATAGQSGGSGSGGGTTTTSKGGGGGDNGATGCPPGVTVKSSGNADADGDELGTEPDDQDGCV